VIGVPCFFRFTSYRLANIHHTIVDNVTPLNMRCNSDYIYSSRIRIGTGGSVTMTTIEIEVYVGDGYVEWML